VQCPSAALNPETKQGSDASKNKITTSQEILAKEETLIKKTPHPQNFFLFTSPTKKKHKA